VTVSLDALQRGDAAAPAELGGVGAIHPETARRIACDAVRTVAVVAGEDAGSTAVGTLSVERDAASTPGGTLSVGRARRTIPAPIRTALALRDKGCRFPGCDRPVGWTDGHHIQHWADHGETEVPNLVSLCRRHHHMVHERGWSIRLEPNGSVTVAEPRGRPSLVRRL
jgi:HNH endonuclease